MQTKTNY